MLKTEFGSPGLYLGRKLGAVKLCHELLTGSYKPQRISAAFSSVESSITLLQPLVEFDNILWCEDAGDLFQD